MKTKKATWKIKEKTLTPEFFDYAESVKEKHNVIEIKLSDDMKLAEIIMEDK